MADQIRYDLLTQKALRGVVRSVLADAVKKGLPGEHHFYISFDTQADDVKLSQRLRAQYPQEMTIILQHQFWDLTVDDDGFEVGLSFGGVPERLAVPFDAIKSFFDPSVQFGLQFEEIVEGQENTPAAPAPAAEAGPRRPLPQTATPGTPVQSAKKPVPAPANPPTEIAPEPAPPDNGSAQVVQLDRFRKK
ncbi:MAG: SspB family protein [Xanthobacteraceae bacterium]|uniref:SspB family protein n=1 Tax=Pseudolabrys sp. TaxID=1960880 RepID=UPI003D0E3F34